MSTRTAVDHRLPRQRRRRARLAAVVSVALALLSACSADAPPTTPSPSSPTSAVSGPAVAQQWFAARTQALSTWVENVAAFHAPDVVLDHSALGVPPAQGRAAALDLLQSHWDPHMWRRVPTGAAYLAHDGAITVERFLDRTRRVNGMLPGSGAFVHAVTGVGITAETFAPGIADVWVLSRYHVPNKPRMHEALALAERYAEAWSAGTGADVAALYARRATLEDSARGVQVTGRSEIAAQAASPPSEGGLPDATIRTITDDDSLAVYVGGPWPDHLPIEHLILLVQLPADMDQLAIELTIDAKGRIIAERRYHRVDSIVRAALHPAGWWDDAVVPARVPRVLTSTETFGSRQVEVFNDTTGDTTGLASMLRWAAARFETAGLSAPQISSLTFLNPGTDVCAGVNGLILGGAITLCFKAPQVCVDAGCTQWRTYAKDTLLHEIGHAWIDENVDSATRKTFLERTGQLTWAAVEHPWRDRGVEAAATTLAWALMDEPFDINPNMALRSRAELTDLFEILTGSPPPESAPDCPAR